MSPADLDAIRRELAAIAELDVEIPGHLRRYTDAWANVARHVPRLLDEIEQLRIERDDNRTEIGELHERLARADTTPWRPAPEAADELLARARTHLTQCSWHDHGLVEYGCQCPGTDPRPVIADLVAEIERLRGGGDS